MQTRKLTPEISAAPQLELADLAIAAKAGFRSIICNRPDGEGEGQPTFAEIERVANDNGMVARYLPAEPGKVTDEHATAFGELMADVPKPVLAFCKTGTRAATMWALSQAGQTPVADILVTAKSAGYDLDGVKERIVARSAAPST